MLAMLVYVYKIFYYEQKAVVAKLDICSNINIPEKHCFSNIHFLLI